MKVHIFTKYDTIDKIINNYAISLDDLKKANPSLDLFNLKIGEKIYIKHFDDTFKQIDNEINLSSEEFQKYICPHCKNIILIPR